MPTYLNILSNNILRNRAKSKGLNPLDYGEFVVQITGEKILSKCLYL